MHLDWLDDPLTMNDEIRLLMVGICLFIVVHIVSMISTSKEMQPVSKPGKYVANQDVAEEEEVLIKNLPVHDIPDPIIQVHSKELSDQPIWNLSYDSVALKFKRNYKPIKIFPGGLESAPLWNYFEEKCTERIYNGTQSSKIVDKVEVSDCAMDSIMEKRRLAIRKTCMALRQYRFPTEEEKIELASKIFPLVKRKLIYCPVYKAGSTNWLANLKALSIHSARHIDMISKARHIQGQLVSQARYVAPEMPFTELMEFMMSHPEPVSFIIVRHPFSRLLSAYRDKFETWNPYFASKYGKQIIRRYRQQGLERFGHDYYKKWLESLRPNKKKPPNGFSSVGPPTFWEFVTAILQGLLDPHWTPASELCGVCKKGMKYNIVIRMENYTEESSYMMRRFGIDTILKPSWFNKNKRGPINQENMEEYFSQLSEDEIIQLYEFYKMDFILFGYEIEPSYLIRKHR